MSNQLDQVLDLKPQVLTLPISQIKFPFADQPIAEVAGYSVVMDPEARGNVVKLSGLDDKTMQTIRTTSGDKATDIILKRAVEALGNQQVTLAFDGNRVTRVVAPEKKKEALGRLQVVQMCEMLTKKGLKVWGVQTSPDGTGANIQLLNPIQHEHPTQKNETVTIGRSIHWDALGGTSLHDFVQRMFCSNGATTQEDGKLIRVLKPDTDIAQIYSALFESGAEKTLGQYFRQMEKLQEMRLSVREWNQLEPWLQKFEKDGKVIEDHIGYEPGKYTWQDQYTKAGIDLDKVTMEQQKVCQTPINWWDMFNCLTWLASHENNSNVGQWQQSKLMQVAGKQLSRKQFDAQMWMQNLPSFN